MADSPNLSVARVMFQPFGSFLEHTLAQPPLPSSPKTLHLLNGTRVDHCASGVLRIEPPVPAIRQLIISAGIHGNETAPIEVCNDLVSELLQEQWPMQTRTLIIFGNPPAMVAGERFLDYNLNRLFGGIHRRPDLALYWESGRAAQLERQVELFARADLPLFHYDLHTAIRDSQREKFALYPFVSGRKVPPDQVRFLLDSDVDTLLYQHKAGSTFSSWTASTFGAESFTIELGKVRPFGENDRSRFRAVENALRRLMRGKWPIADTTAVAAISEFRVVQEIINTGAGFVFHVADDVANFTAYPPGTLIWQDGEREYRVGNRPEFIVFPNPRVPTGQRVGLMVAAAD